MPLALLAKRPLVHFDLRSEDETAVPLLRSDEAQLISRELLYLMLDLDSERRDRDGRCRAADRVDPRRRAGGGGRDRRGGRGARGQLGPLPGFAALAAQLTRGFLLCAVLNDVTAPAGDQVRLRRAARRGRGAAVHFYDAPGCTEAASYHAEVDVPDELRARTTEMIDDVTGDVLAHRAARRRPPGDPLRRRARRAA